MKITIGRDERYPDYYVKSASSREEYLIEVSEEEWKNFVKAEEAYADYQELLDKLYWEARGKT